MSLDTPNVQARPEKPRKTRPVGLWAVSICLATIALLAAFVVPFYLVHQANPVASCNNGNIDQSYCSRILTVNCSTPTSSLETPSIQCINANYDYFLSVPANHCGSEAADYFNINKENGFSHLLSSGGQVSTYMSVAYNSTGVVTLAESAVSGCLQSSVACLNYFAFSDQKWSGFDCSFTGIGPTWTSTCYPFKVQLLNSSALLVSVVGVSNVTYSRLKNGNNLGSYVDSGIVGVPCL